MAKLKAVLKNLDGLDEALKALYTKEGDVYVLDAEVDEHPATRGLKSALDKEKDDRRKARETLKAMLTRLGVDSSEDADEMLEQLMALKKEADKHRDKKLIDQGKVDELIAERVAAMKKEYDKNLGNLTKERDALKSVAERAMVDNALSAAAVKARVRNSALQDVLLRGKMVFRLDGEKVVAVDGDKPRFGKNGEALGMEEWVETLREDAPHLFESSTGGGANGSSGSRAGNGIVLTREQARDPRQYRAATEQAKKEGKEVMISN